MLETARKVTQIALLVVAVVAASGAAYRYVVARDLFQPAPPAVTVLPASGPVGLRPFLELTGFDLEEPLTVYLCPQDSAEGELDDCIVLAEEATEVRFQSAVIPRSFPSGEPLEPGVYPLRAGPDEEGDHIDVGEFRVVPFRIGPSPEPRPLEGLDLASLELEEPREVARRVPCRPEYVPDGRLAVGQVLLDPRTGVTVDLTVRGAELAWSPDGDRLAVVTEDRKEIRLAEPDGENAVAVVREARGLISSVSWSPEGDRFAYVARSDPGATGGPGAPAVFVFSALDGSTTRIGPGVWVAWSPGDERMVIESAGAVHIREGTGEMRQLVAGRRPAWSPDAALVTYVHPEGGESGEGWVARARDGATARLLSEPVCGLVFSRTGNSVALVRQESEGTTLFVRRLRLPEEADRARS